LHASGVLDFDDLLLYMVKLLNDPKTLEWFRKRYQHLLIDEYQDTNGPQYEIVKQIGGKHRNVCVVGDASQTIYTFTGASSSYLVDFRTRFPHATEVRLVRSYRSSPQVVALADDPLHPESVARTWSASIPGAALGIVGRQDPARDRGALGRTGRTLLLGA